MSCDLLSTFDINLVLSHLQEMQEVNILCCDLLSTFDINLVLSHR